MDGAVNGCHISRAELLGSPLPVSIPPVRPPLSVPLAILLAAGIHLDWHLARSHHHRLSLEWRHHWLLAPVLFGAAAWYVARRWPDETAAA